MKTIVYVDGYNLFYGCLKHSKDKWLDLYELLTNKIVKSQNPDSDVVCVKFFTADIKAKIASNGARAQIAQQNYHRALLQLYPEKLQIIKGYYSLEKRRLLAYKTPPVKTDRVDVWGLEEKQTDVNIALEAYRDAINKKAEQFVFVSNDTDLAPALKAIRDELKSSVEIGIIIPVRKTTKGRPANAQLSQFANWTRKHITDLELTNSQLPIKIPTKKKPIIKPEYWV